MGAHNPVTLSTNTLSHHPTTPTNAERTIETCVPHPTISDRQPLCELYRYILNDSKQGQRVRGSARLVQPSSQAAINYSSVIRKWLETAPSDDDEDDNETVSTTSGSRLSSAKRTALLHRPPPHPKPVAPEVYHLTKSHEAEALYGPFSRSNDYESQDGPSDSPQDITQDAEMGDSKNRFKDEVMIYYNAALSSAGSDPIFDTCVPEPGSEKIARVSVRALQALNAEETAGEGWFEVTPEVGGEETGAPDGIREDHTHPLTEFLFTRSGDEDLMLLDAEENAGEGWSKVTPEVGGEETGAPHGIWEDHAHSLPELLLTGSGHEDLMLLDAENNAGEGWSKIALDARKKLGPQSMVLKTNLNPPTELLLTDARYDNLYKYKL